MALTHDELLKAIEGFWHDSYRAPGYNAMRAIVELHRPWQNGLCIHCTDERVVPYPCPTIKAIEAELG